jgi:hypothetical protein
MQATQQKRSHNEKANEHRWRPNLGAERHRAEGSPENADEPDPRSGCGL